VNGSNKLLMIFVEEADRWRNIPLHQALVDKLAGLDVAAATALEGLGGFGGTVSLDRPMTVLAFDTEAKLASVMPHLRPMTRGAVMMTMDADLVHLSPGSAMVN
jgi:PII-like signaling protein